jgi:hypothetical protein
MGRCVGMLFTDALFKETVYRVDNKEKLFQGIDCFMNRASILPANWDNKIRV